MNARVDLMPDSCRIRLGHRSRVRRWILSYSAAAIGLTVLIIGAEIHERTRLAQVATLQRQVDFSVEQRRKADELTARIAEIDAALLQHETLALPLRVTTALRALGACTPESVTLTSLTMTPRLVRERSAKPGEPGTEQRWLLFELRGLAPSDTDLAQMVAGLETSELFSTASVDYTTQTEIHGVQAREFGVTCEVSLEREFVFAEATP